MDNKIIIGIINECIDLDATFTFYDVFSEARERNCKVDACDVEEIVNGFKYPQYYKQTEFIDEGRVFNVIHPSDRFAESYEFPESDIVNESFPVDRVSQTNNSRPKHATQEDRYKDKSISKQIKVQIEKSLPATGNPDDYKIIESILTPRLFDRPLFDRRGRHTVLASDVKKAGFNVGDVVYVVIGMGVVTLSLDKPPLSTANFGNSADIGLVGTLTVDKYYNLRINIKSLLTAINSIPCEYDGHVTNVEELTSIIAEPIENTKIINLYPKA